MSPSQPTTTPPALTPARSGWPSSCATCCATRSCSRPTTATPTVSRTPTRCAACRRSTAPPCDSLRHARGVLEIEINSATDNPLVFPAGSDADPGALATGGGLVISGGNFHGQPVALVMDFAALAIAELGSISERRTALLIDGHRSGLPPFLAENPGLDSGLMLLQYAAASLVSENKVLVHPASADSIPTSANQEDHVSMGATAARQARDILRNVEHVLAHGAAVCRPGPRLPDGAHRPARDGRRRRRTDGCVPGCRTWTPTASPVPISRPLSSSYARTPSATCCPRAPGSGSIGCASGAIRGILCASCDPSQRYPAWR